MDRPIQDDGVHRLAQTAYGNLLYRTDDPIVGRSLETYGEWGESEFEVFRQILRPGDTVIDAGAGIGTHTLFFSKSVETSGRVFAYEPHSESFSLLRANIELNELKNVAADQLRLGATAANALDSLQFPTCRLLKIDVDGEECDIIAGAAGLISRLKPVVFVENNDAKKSAVLIEMLLKLDCALYWHLDFAFRKGNYRGHENDIFRGAFDVNLLAIPKVFRTNLKNFTPVTGPEDTWQAAMERSKLSK